MPSRRLCVFCGSSPGRRQAYTDAAASLGRSLAERDVGLVYGGGRVGLMGVLADACLDAGGEVIGVIPGGLFRTEVAHTGLTELVTVASMHERKARMTALSDGFVVLPGGFGTLDETFEALTWRQIGIHDKPIALLDADGFFDPLLAHVDRAVAEGFVRPAHRDLLVIEDDVDRLLDRLEPLLPRP